MQKTSKHKRHTEISAAAYALLAEKGYAGASMLSIAKASKASNETLYRWYGDKNGLFAALVHDNAQETQELLTKARDTQLAPLDALAHIAPIFLRMLLGDKAILLNRAAAADTTGALGAAIETSGRQVIRPLFQDILRPLAQDIGLPPETLTGLFLGTLIGDQQIKRVIGVVAAPTEDDIQTRVAQSLSLLRSLLDR